MKPDHFPPLRDISKHRNPIPDEQNVTSLQPLSLPASPLPLSSPKSPRRPMRQAATKAKQRFSEIYAPLITEEDSEVEYFITSPTGANFTRPPPSLSWLSDSSDDDDEYIDDGDNESDEKWVHPSGLGKKRGTKRPKTAYVEGYDAKLDHTKMTITAGKAGTRKRTKLARNKKAGSDADSVGNPIEKGKTASWEAAALKEAKKERVASCEGAAKKQDGSMRHGLRWASAEAKLVARSSRHNETSDVAIGEMSNGSSDSDVTLVGLDGEHERPVSDVTLVGEQGAFF